MEVTPSTLRDSVSSGVGAKRPHGRVTPPLEKEDNTELRSTSVRRELPVDLAEVRLAESLQRSDPSMDAVTAAKLAKQLLERPAKAKWETEKAEVGGQKEHVDELA